MALYRRAHCRLEVHYGATHARCKEVAAALGRVRRQKKKRRDQKQDRSEGRGQQGEGAEPDAEPGRDASGVRGEEV